MLFPLVNGRNVELRLYRRPRIPELPKISAALIGGIAAPQQFAAHFSVEPHQERFDEFRVRLKQLHGVGRHLVQTGKNEILRKVAEGFVHRLRESRRVHDRLQLIAGFRLRTVDLKAGHYRIANCYGWIQTGERRSLNCAELHLHERVGQKLLMCLRSLVKLMWRLGRRLSRGKPGSHQAVQAKRREHLQKVIPHSFQSLRSGIENRERFRRHHNWSTMICDGFLGYAIRDDF